MLHNHDQTLSLVVSGCYPVHFLYRDRILQNLYLQPKVAQQWAMIYMVSKYRVSQEKT